jgi:hypothetical protein
MCEYDDELKEIENREWYDIENYEDLLELRNFIVSVMNKA